MILMFGSEQPELKPISTEPLPVLYAQTYVPWFNNLERKRLWQRICQPAVGLLSRLGWQHGDFSSGRALRFAEPGA